MCEEVSQQNSHDSVSKWRMADQTVDGARGLTADRWRRSSRLPWAAVLEPTRSSRAQRRVHGGAAVGTKRSGLKIPDDELSSEIKNSAKIMIIYNTVLRYLGVTPVLLRGKLDNDATSTDTAGHDSFRSIKASSTRLVAGKEAYTTSPLVELGGRL